MTTSNLLSQSTALTGIGALLAGVLWVNLAGAQTDDRDDGTDPPITSAPGEDPRGGGGIDYENAEPMPMPSLPDPSPLDSSPTPPAADGSMGHPGSSPGSTGTGEETPQVLIPSARD